jgi:hypothetical protein
MKDKASQLKAVREQLLQIMTVDEQDSYSLVLCALNDYINDVESGWMDN